MANSLTDVQVQSTVELCTKENLSKEIMEVLFPGGGGDHCLHFDIA